jgi:monoamine oxidase
LVAARGLAAKGFEVTLLEAKERLGGRIFTKRVGETIVELGAEFVHGESKPMERLLREMHLELIEVRDQNRLVKNGQMKDIDLWKRVGEVIGKIDAKERDLTFSEWLEKTDLDRESRKMAMGFVEGFNASDAQIIGAHSLLRAQYESEKSGGDQQARLREGYGALVEKLAAAATAKGVKVQTGARVRLVKWKRAKVTVTLERGNPLEADLAVVTLPLGVLKSGRVVFQPSLPHKLDAINGLVFGNVAKMAFIFRSRWWKHAELQGNFGFVHAFAESIPTWWSDSRAPILVGWVAGPKADAMLNLNGTQLRARALEIMGRIFSREVKDIEAELVAYDHYDWRADRDVGGAYSYIPVNGMDLPKVLAAPVEGTLFFAGEATAMDAQMGTVTGAVESGLRVVEEIG